MVYRRQVRVLGRSVKLSVVVCLSITKKQNKVRLESVNKFNLVLRSQSLIHHLILFWPSVGKMFQHTLLTTHVGLSFYFLPIGKMFSNTEVLLGVSLHILLLHVWRMCRIRCNNIIPNHFIKSRPQKLSWDTHSTGDFIFVSVQGS